MVWGGITVTGRTDFRICRGNVSLGCTAETMSLSLLSSPSPALIFQNDNARDHRARAVQDHLQFCRITTLPWSAKSSDLSPTENLWDISRDVSGDGLTSHRTSTSSLMHSSRNGAGFPSNHWAAHQEHEASLSRVPGGDRRPYSLLRLL